MDVRFFVIAVIIQRATGGDLAEVLDKIGRLIRQRFELFGHVKALTAEGRLSGIVLLALPPDLLAFLSTVNYDYMRPLFTTPVGTKMLTLTAVLQLMGGMDDQQDRRDQGVNGHDANSRSPDPIDGLRRDHAGDLGRVELPRRAADQGRRPPAPAAGRDRRPRRRRGRGRAPPGGFQQQVTQAAKTLGQSLRPSDEEELGKVRLKLLNAGYRHENAVAIFFGMKVMGMLVGLAVCIPGGRLEFGMTQTAITMTIGGGAIGFYLPGFVVGPARRNGSSRSSSDCPTRST